jgi:predicted nucleotidyltransferase
MTFNHSSLNRLLGSAINLKILRFIFAQKAQLTERQLAKFLGVSHMKINRLMRELEAIHCVNSMIIGKANIWRVNKSSYAYLTLSRILNSLAEENAPLADLKRNILSALPRPGLEKVILFGSVSRGTERLDSDIDLFVLVKDQKTKYNMDKKLDELVITCLDRYGNLLMPYLLTKNELKERKALKVIAEIEKGLQLYPPIKK